MRPLWNDHLDWMSYTAPKLIETTMRTYANSPSVPSRHRVQFCQLTTKKGQHLSHNVTLLINLHRLQQVGFRQERMREH